MIQNVPLRMAAQPFMSIKEDVKRKNVYTDIYSDMICRESEYSEGKKFQVLERLSNRFRCALKKVL